VVRLLDADPQIRLFVKLKLASCARAGDRAGLFCGLESLRGQARVATAATACLECTLSMRHAKSRLRACPHKNKLVGLPDAAHGQPIPAERARTHPCLTRFCKSDYS
jgi:hypothetical protein